jgi:small nuclear ribonucleoprotein (snRNP)-like protein
MLVELKNGETLNGHLVQCDTYMNLTLKEVVQTSPEGDKFFRLPECYVRGNNVSRVKQCEIALLLLQREENQTLTTFRLSRSNTSASPMKSSTSSKSNKLQRKRSEAADIVEAVVEIAAIAVAAGDKVVVVGEEEAGARHRREPELERGTFMLSRNDHKHYDTPGFFCLRRWVRNLFLCFVLDGEDIIWPSFCWQVSDLLAREAFFLHAKESVLL